LIRWHSTTCKTCAHYLWNLSSGELAGYGCAVLANLTTPNAGDEACPSFLEHQYTGRWFSRVAAKNRVERLPDYTADGRWSVVRTAEESAEWTAAICQHCGEYLHSCRCEAEPGA
jgi:hypothetical protein